MKIRALRPALTAGPLPAGPVLGLAGLGLVGLIIGIVLPSGIPAPLDKAVHAGFFLAFAALLLRLCPGRVIAVALVAAGLGGAGELAQALTPHHTASLADFAADLLGVAAAIGLAPLGFGARAAAQPA